VSLDIFPDNIKFKIYGAVDFHFLHIGMFESKWNDRYGELVLCNIITGQADTINAYGAFFNDERRKGEGKAETVFGASIFREYFHTGADSVHMTLNQVAVEAAINLHTPFKIYCVTHQPDTEVGLFQGFIDSRYAVLVVGNLLYGKAGSVMGKALVGLQISGNR